jgi:crossover junction endodeoxyribonuclease RusA
MYTFEIPLQPTACPRPRVTKFGTYYSKPYKKFQKESLVYLKTQIDESFSQYKDSVHITYIFVFNRPKYMQAKKYSNARILHNKRPDLDNLVKAVNDSLQAAKIIKDDSQITGIDAYKYYAAIGEYRGIYLSIKEG